MLKNLSVLLCLLGVALASGRSGLKAAESSKVVKMLETIKKHQEYFGVCEDVLGNDMKIVKSCSALAQDIATLESLLTKSISTGEYLYEQGVELMAEFTKCSTENIFKQIACYENVVISAKKLIATAEEDITELEGKLEEVVPQIETDIQNCFGSGYTSDLLDAKLSLCKLRLMFKN